jgi:hypothetical protein
MPAYFEAGKGSVQRPENHDLFSDHYDLIFGNHRNSNQALDKLIEEVYNTIPVVYIPTVTVDNLDEDINNP